MLLASILPLIAQASILPPLEPVMTDSALREPPPVQQDRLTVCLDQVRTDPPTAIVTASSWIGEASGPDLAFPHQCLGMAYTRLLRWEAAERAFLAARDAAAPDNNVLRSKLAAMAGNSALAEQRSEAALADFALALQDANAAQDKIAAGEIEIDRSRALVALGRNEEAAQALAAARQGAPQNSDAWLLSATLERRAENLAGAQNYIETAAALDPENPAIGLEAGVIAILSGREEAARKSWQSVIETAPDSAEAGVATDYLAQITGQSQEEGR